MQWLGCNNQVGRLYKLSLGDVSIQLEEVTTQLGQHSIPARRLSQANWEDARTQQEGCNKPTGRM